MSGYDFHPEALADLDEILDFIAEDNVNAAERVIRDILAGVRKLATSPYQGRGNREVCCHLFVAYVTRQARVALLAAPIRILLCMRKMRAFMKRDEAF